MTLKVSVGNRLGLHARAAAKLVKLAAKFEADIKIANAAQPREEVSALSVLGLMMLQALKGSTLVVKAKGPQAEMAEKAIVGLVKRKFDEE